MSSATQAAARGTARPGRRALFATLVLLVAAALLALALYVLSPGGWSVPEALILLCLVANLPWLALAAATGVMGLAVRLSGDAEPAPEIAIALRTLIAVCVRDEPMEALLPSLGELLDALLRARHGDRFAIAILSDTADPAHVEAEEQAVRRFAAAHPPGAVLYRRRTDNAGYKAGNVMEFLDHHAEGFALMVLLDADSQMTPAAVLRLVRAMQAAPRLGILQFPITGRPSRAPFGRLFDVGHRASGLTWTLGQAWWQGDEGPFWGHNAAIRIAPFRAHCRLAPLPDGTHILSHDHVEAARLHAAGWGVRVLPATPEEAKGSRESHPPHLLAFLDRDWRWAAGNLQYRHLLRDRSLGAIGRFQMFQAILHYLLSPLWFAMLPLAALNAATDGEGTPHGALILLLVLGYAALHLPRLAGHAVALLRGAPGGRAAHIRLVLAEAVFLLLFQPIHAFHSTMIVLSHALGLPRVGWPVQQREERRLGWGETAACLWPHTAMGLAILALLVASGSSFALAVGLPLVAGLVLAIPFCVLTSIPAR